jgi:hypothetical protein
VSEGIGQAVTAGEVMYEPQIELDPKSRAGHEVGRWTSIRFRSRRRGCQHRAPAGKPNAYLEESSRFKTEVSVTSMTIRWGSTPCCNRALVKRPSQSGAASWTAEMLILIGPGRSGRLVSMPHTWSRTWAPIMVMSPVSSATPEVLSLFGQGSARLRVGTKRQHPIPFGTDQRPGQRMKSAPRGKDLVRAML